MLRERVTSKGGTTAAALDVMGQREIARHIGEAIEAVKARYVPGALKPEYAASKSFVTPIRASSSTQPGRPASSIRCSP